MMLAYMLSAVLFKIKFSYTNRITNSLDLDQAQNCMGLDARNLSSGGGGGGGLRTTQA